MVRNLSVKHWMGRTMIRFVVGFLTIVAAVAAMEGTASLSTSIILATTGTIIMLWGISGMDERYLG